MKNHSFWLDKSSFLQQKMQTESATNCATGINWFRQRIPSNWHGKRTYRQKPTQIQFFSNQCGVAKSVTQRFEHNFVVATCYGVAGNHLFLIR